MRTLRSFFVLLALLPILTLFLPAARRDVAEYLVYVGTYTDKGSKGIYAYRYNSSAKKFASLGLAAETENPSFLAVAPGGRFLYAVNETGNYKSESSGGVSAFRIDPASSKLTLLNERASRGADPCYAAFDKTGKFLMVANYTGGSIAVFPLGQDGRLDEASAFVQHQGSSVHPNQKGPHAHWIETSPDNRFALAADLGLDQVLVYRFHTGKLTRNHPPFAKLAPGSGPRHVVFSPNRKFVYVVNELNSTVAAFSWDAKKGALHELQTLSTLPRGFSAENTTAEIAVHPSGKFLYASNRGHDSIAVFQLDPESGRMEARAQTPSGGKEPRHFAIDPTGRLLLAANQNSGTIAVFQVDPETGALKATGEVLWVPTPVCIVFVPVQ